MSSSEEPAASATQVGTMRYSSEGESLLQARGLRKYPIRPTSIPGVSVDGTMYTY